MSFNQQKSFHILNRRLIHPAQDFVQGVMYYAVGKVERREEKGRPTALYLLSSERKLFTLSHGRSLGLSFRHEDVQPPAMSKAAIERVLRGSTPLLPADVHRLLDAYLRHYIVLNEPAYRTFLALWTMGTYVHRIFRYYPYVYSKGKKYRTKPYHTKTEAKDALNRLRVEVKQQRRQISAKITFAKFSDEFLEDARLNSRNYVSHIYRLKHLKPFFRNAKLEDITRADVHRYINQRLREEANRATINRELACLKRMLNVAVEWEKLVVNPMYRMKLLKEEERPVRSLSPEEEDRLLTYCRYTAHPVYKIMEPIILVAEHTGMRQSELLNLKWEQVDFLNSVITLSKTKAKKIRLLPMNSVVVDTLLKLKSGAEFVFPINRKGDYRSRFKYHWGELCKNVGLANFRFHDLRATFATRLDSKGVGAFTIKSLLGHSTLEVTKRYIGVDESSRRAVEKLSTRHEIRHLEEESVD